MKRYRILFPIIAVAFLASCAGITVTPDNTRIVIAKSTARIFGYKLVEQNPSVAPAAKQICNMLTTGDPTQSAIDAAVAAAMEYFSGDPLMAATFMDLLSLVKIQSAGANSAAYDPKLVMAGAQGCLEGIQMYQSQRIASVNH